MKSIQKELILAIILGVFIILSGCKKDTDSPNEEVIQLGKLSGTWTANTVMNGVELEGYEDFTLTISSNPGGVFTYTTAGRPELSPWPASGSWVFGSTVASQIVRESDGVIMTYTVTDTALTLEFDFSGEGYPNTRMKSLEGNWMFTFSRQ